jgi:VWFA-related protein
MPTRGALVSAAVILAALTTSAQSSGQQKPPRDPQQPVFRTEANFIRVDVFPTKDGIPVKNLTAADFELLEDGVAQKIETFQYVEVRSTPQELRQEPNTIGESRNMMRNPRARLFVLFLDVPNVTIHGTWTVREPLVRFMDRVLGEEDLIGIMTPTMSPADVVFARKTQVLAGGLRDKWPFGERYTLAEDEKDALYSACYPWDATRDVVAEMKARRKERMTFDALRDLVTWLRDQREERKAIITVSEGWRLFRENRDLTRLRVIDPISGSTEPVPGPEPIGVGPDGRLRVGNPYPDTGTKTDCDRERLQLSLIDNEQYFRDLIDIANRANASFYTVDPRGLPAADAPIGPAPPPPLLVDQTNLRNRIETLQVLASNTDGVAVINSNDIDRGLRRMADDLTSYYLLGYYSTNAKLDGRFRQIRVKVARPDVDVRARRGYKAATREDVDRSKITAPAPLPESVAVARGALESLARLRVKAPLRTRAVIAPLAHMVWVTGELEKAAEEPARVEITVTSGATSASGTAEIGAGRRTFVSAVPFEPNGEGQVDVRVRVSSPSGVVRIGDTVRTTLTEGLPDPMLFRRGPSTGNQLQPLAEPLFSRTERARFEVPLAAETTITAARLLDRNGNALEVPVTVGERTDAAGVRWKTIDATLAPLAAGDYVLEVTGTLRGGEKTLLTAFRVTR